MILFLGDTHLGSKRCKAQRLLDFLHSIEDRNTIFLLGDIIDDRPMKPRWPMSHIYCLKELLKFKNIYYICGNHDKFMRKYWGIWRDNIMVVDYYRLEIDGKYYFITHGDHFDRLIRWTHLISESYFARIYRKLIGHWHDRFTGHNSHFEKEIVKAAKNAKCNGVICGHSHNPCIKLIDKIEYLNAGDATDNCTAIIEENGKFRLASY